VVIVLSLLTGALKKRAKYPDYPESKLEQELMPSLRQMASEIGMISPAQSSEGN